MEQIVCNPAAAVCKKRKCLGTDAAAGALILSRKRRTAVAFKAVVYLARSPLEYLCKTSFQRSHGTRVGSCLECGGTAAFKPQTHHRIALSHGKVKDLKAIAMAFEVDKTFIDLRALKGLRAELQNRAVFQISLPYGCAFIEF